MRIRWTPADAADLNQINEYLKSQHPRHRRPTIQKLHDSILLLKRWPQRGRAGQVEGTRELVFTLLPYIAVYRVAKQSIEILRIYHAAQNRV